MRLVDWEQRLNDYIAEASPKPYAYGRHDCLLHCATAVKAVTGTDHGKKHRGKYKSAASASRYLRSLGADSPEQFLDGLFEEKPVGFAQRGDLVLVDIAEQRLPGVCLGDKAAVVGEIEGFEGLILIARPAWVKAWSVE